jgi:ABC-type glycerol-3-phosphate transport system substrate-binding protein
MGRIIVSRREFLRVSALTAAGLLAAQCGAPAPQAPPAATEAPAATKAPAVTEAPAAPAAEEVTLDVMMIDEYEGQYREIWNVFEAKHPGIKITVHPVNEDMAGAWNAKVAGGWLPTIELTTNLQIFANKDNYEMFVDLSSFDFPYWDRWTFDVKNAWSDVYGLPGPRTLDVFKGWVVTWQWRTDLMEKAGFNPKEEVKTWDDLKRFLAEGAAWAKATPDVDYFWDVAWHNFAFGPFYLDLIPLAFPDGQRDRQRDCFMGKAKFNAPDSPYRHCFEFFKEASDKGWIPERSWTRQWEQDMEALFIGGKSVMMLHGPWVWDKYLAADPNAVQSGMPATPPAEGQDTWIQGAFPPAIDAGWFIRAGNEKTAYWEQTQTAWNWIHSPEAIAIRAQAEGRDVTYKLDEPLDLKGPQFQGVLKEIGTPDGAWPDVVWEESQTGDIVSGPYLKKGAKGAWDWQSNNNSQYWSDYLSGKMTLQEVLDLVQKNWDESYEGLPV